MEKSWQIPRRAFLRGLGTAMSLPLLEAMAPAVRAAGEARAGFGPNGHPLRMAFIYHPNGVIVPDWKPTKIGKDYDLRSTLNPIQAFRKDFSVITGLKHDKARANGDGAGDHARANATFLTAVQARKTAGADIRLGVSVDQVAAQRVGAMTRFPSIELGSEKARQAGKCDSGYSCAYQYNMAWKSEALPLAPESDPRQVFERLFSIGNSNESKESRVRRQRYEKSILDFVLEDARRLQNRLGYTDRRKLDEYLTAVREMEQRIERAEKFDGNLPDLKKPAGIPKDFAQHVRLMYDLMAVAFQTDTTRVATFLVAHDGSNRAYREIGVKEGHHSLSHHRDEAAMIADLRKIDYYLVTQFGYFLNRLRSTQEGDGNLLDNSMIVYGGGISDGNRHRHDDLPVLLAGRAGGSLNPGRHIAFEPQLPMSNLYLSMLDRMGVSTPRFGDSTGRLAGI